MVRGNCNGVVAVVNTINMRGVLKWFAYNLMVEPFQELGKN